MAALNLVTPTSGGTWRFPANEPLRLDSGGVIKGLEIAYQTYGQLNADKSNAVLICHALTMDQYVASPHPVTTGWWFRTSHSSSMQGRPSA